MFTMDINCDINICLLLTARPDSFNRYCRAKRAKSQSKYTVKSPVSDHAKCQAQGSRLREVVAGESLDHVGSKFGELQIYPMF